MSLLDIWNKSPEIRDKHIKQIFGFAGDGKLLDGNSTSIEFRELLSNVSSSYLAQFSNQCLEEKFDNSGFVLQDTVNEIGKRLGFEVTNGLYRGSSRKIGFDGLWKSSAGDSIVVEIKTSSTYSIDFGVVANYKNKLIKEGTVHPDKNSILIVVGRFDTGGWEAQIRGSKYAWDIRLISVEGLIRLLSTKENLDDPYIITKIRDILVPKEYTRVDSIIDLVFSTAEDIKEDHLGETEEEVEEETTSKEKEKESIKVIPVSFHQDCIQKVEKHLEITLIQESRTIFKTPDGKKLISCSVSKEHQKKEKGPIRFWFAFHKNQKEYLSTTQESYLALGCGSSRLIFLIPVLQFIPLLEKLHKTKNGNREYWHVNIKQNTNGYHLQTKRELKNITLDKYII